MDLESSREESRVFFKEFQPFCSSFPRLRDRFSSLLHLRFYCALRYLLRAPRSQT
nr:MAG TPA: hypothetical protein [Caudoviricetes sp.]